MRTCTNCGEKMAEGYLLEEMGFTFCSDFCLDVAYPGSSKEMANMTEEQLEESTWYWTSWEADDTDDDDDLEPEQQDPRLLPHLTDDDDLDSDDDESSSLISYEDIVRAAKGGLQCPVCMTHNLDPNGALNAISRKDNITEICSECGSAEALEELNDYLEGIGWYK